MDLPSVWNVVVAKDTGVLAIAVVSVGLAVGVATILRHRAETKKIQLDAAAAARAERRERHARVCDCAEDIRRSASVMVDELFAAFYFFAHPPANPSSAKLRAELARARRFRYEQRYRAETEAPLAKLVALGGTEGNEAVTLLHARAVGLLAKVAEKKIHAANIEARGLSPENVAAVAAWLSEIREQQVGIAFLVGAISGQLALAEDKHKTERAVGSMPAPA